MFKNITALQEVIDPSIEPGVISHKMIQDSYLNLYIGEKRRLKELEAIEYDNITIIRLEFKNILRIDHLWILPNLTKLSLNYNKIERIENIESLVNLTDLNLSFNYIEQIENLETLIKLETLSLFNNLIKKIENLDDLQNLEILSLGNNQIETLNGIERFRFFKKLKVLNLEGNPVCKDENRNIRVYLTAILPRLQYYNYVFITEKDHADSLEKYRHEVELIETNEIDELTARAKKEKDIADEIRLSSSFVEFLNEHQLFESLWDGDEDGAKCRLIGDEAEELIYTYKEDFFKITQEIFKIGYGKYTGRTEEIELFEKCLEDGRKLSQQKSIAVVEEFQSEAKTILGDVRKLFIKIEKFRQQGLEDDSEEIQEINAEIEILYLIFKEKLDIIWEKLMAHEVNLYEAVEEVLNTFERSILDLLQAFLENVLSLFATLRDSCRNFAELLSDAVNAYIQYHAAQGGNYHVVPEALHLCIDDKDNIIDLIDGMKNWHIQRVEDREDRLTTRSKNWVKSIVAQKKDEELERNRYKLTEINYFILQMRETFASIQAEVEEEMTNT